MNEKYDEIKNTIRHLDIGLELISPNIILEWEKKYDTQADTTNFAMLIMDCFPEPIKFLKNIDTPGIRISEK